MSPKSSKLSSKTLHSQTREVVWNVYNFMKSEAESGKPLLDFHKVQERVAKVMGISPVSYTHLDVYKRQTLHGATWQHDLYLRFALSPPRLEIVIFVLTCL